MLPDNLGRYYPRLFHMAHADAWSGILKYGLLSTDRLLDIFYQDPHARRLLLEKRRPHSVTLTHPEHGIVVIRDQKPLVESKLKQLLDETTLCEYLTLLNNRVFFWTSEQRLERLLTGRAYRRDPQLVLTVDTRSLVAEYSEVIQLTRINSGATLYVRGRRGRRTFETIAEFHHPRPRHGTTPHTVIELTVEGGVPNIQDHLLLAQQWLGGEPTVTLFERR